MPTALEAAPQQAEPELQPFDITRLSRTPWESVADDFRQAFPELEVDELQRRYTQAQSLAGQRIRLNEAQEGTTSYWLRRSPLSWMPVVGYNQRTASALQEAQRRMESGNAMEHDAEFLATQERLRFLDQDRQSTLGGQVTEAFSRAPGIIGEAVATGPAVGLGGQSAGRVAQAAQAARGTPLLSGATARAAGLTAAARIAQTPLMPSVYGQQAAEANIAAGRRADDVRGYPSAVVHGAIFNAILGSSGQLANNAVTREGLAGLLGRTLARGGIGVAESEMANAVAGAVHYVWPDGLPRQQRDWNTRATEFALFATLGVLGEQARQPASARGMAGRPAEPTVESGAGPRPGSGPSPGGGPAGEPPPGGQRTRTGPQATGRERAQSALRTGIDELVGHGMPREEAARVFMAELHDLQTNPARRQGRADFDLHAAFAERVSEIVAEFRAGRRPGTRPERPAETARPQAEPVPTAPQEAPPAPTPGAVQPQPLTPQGPQAVQPARPLAAPPRPSAAPGGQVPQIQAPEQPAGQPGGRLAALAAGQEPSVQRVQPPPGVQSWADSGTRFTETPTGDSFQAKDGATFEVVQTHQFEPREAYPHGGVRVVARNTDGREVTRTVFARNADGTWSGEGIKTAESLRGQGIASALYDWANKYLGTVVPSQGRTPAGKAFWEANARKQAGAPPSKPQPSRPPVPGLIRPEPRPGQRPPLRRTTRREARQLAAAAKRSAEAAGKTKAAETALRLRNDPRETATIADFLQGTALGRQLIQKIGHIGVIVKPLSKEVLASIDLLVQPEGQMAQMAQMDIHPRDRTRMYGTRVVALNSLKIGSLSVTDIRRAVAHEAAHIARERINPRRKWSDESVPYQERPEEKSAFRAMRSVGPSTRGRMMLAGGLREVRTPGGQTQAPRGRVRETLPAMPEPEAREQEIREAMTTASMPQAADESGLTPLQRQVYDMKRAGLSFAEIGKQLKLSPSGNVASSKQIANKIAKAADAQIGRQQTIDAEARLEAIANRAYRRSQLGGTLAERLAAGDEAVILEAVAAMDARRSQPPASEDYEAHRLVAETFAKEGDLINAVEAIREAGIRTKRGWRPLSLREARAIAEALVHRGIQDRQQSREFAAPGQRQEAGQEEESDAAKTLRSVVNTWIADEAGAATAPTGALMKERLEQVVRFITATADGFRRLSGQMFPTTTRADRAAGEAMARHAASNSAAVEAAEFFTDEIMGPGATEADYLLAGAVLTERRLRFIRLVLQRAGRNADAAKVTSLIGKPGSPLKTFADYQAAMQSPWMDGIRRRWDTQSGFVPFMDDIYRRAVGLGPNDPIDAMTQIPGSPINIKPITGDDAFPPPRSTVFTQAKGDLRNVRARRLGRTRPATGQAEAYDIDIRSIIANTVNGLVEATKADMYRSLEAAGLMRWGKPGDPTDIGGERGRVVPSIRPPRGTQAAQAGQMDAIVKPDIYSELYNAVGVEHKPGWAQASHALTRLPVIASLASLADEIYHSANLFGSIFNPGVIRQIRRNMALRWTNDKAAKKKLLELAMIGAKKPTYHQQGTALVAELRNIGRFLTGRELPAWAEYIDPSHWVGRGVDFLDDVFRLSLSDAHAQLAKQGKLPDTETARRDFINQAVGQYNERAQNSLVRLARWSGIGPFATAGTTFTMRAMRLVYTFGSGVRAKNWRASLQMRAETFAKLASLLGFAAAMNYLLWGQWDGDDSVPFGAIKTGVADDGRSRYMETPASMLARRGMRATPAMAVLDGLRQGKTGSEMADRAALRDVPRSFLHPLTGPAYDFAETALTGRNQFGQQVADRAVPGQSQAVQNVEAAILRANPIISEIWEMEVLPRERGRATTGERLLKPLGPFAPRTAYRRPQDTLGR